MIEVRRENVVVRTWCREHGFYGQFAMRDKKSVSWNVFDGDKHIVTFNRKSTAEIFAAQMRRAK